MSHARLLPPSTSFVGRSGDLDALGALLDGPARLITIIGPPGVGKTRLAAEWIRRSVGRRVVGCSLADAFSAEDLVTAVARALGVGEAPGPALAAADELVLVLDGIDSVVDAASTLEAWLREAPRARFVVTSRRRLRLPDEVLFEVAPLPLPDASLELFTDRARAIRHDFAIAAHETAIVIELLRALDGLPLAIELAAARIQVLTPAQILERLPRRFEVLAGDTTTQGLRAAIAASWAHLGPSERAALGQATVFRGGFSLEAAEEVFDLPQTTPALDVLQSLVERSLLVVHTAGDERRFGLLESIRDFAAEWFSEHGDRVTVEARHARYFLVRGAANADVADGRVKAPAAAVARARAFIAREADNLLAIHARTLGSEAALRAALILTSADATLPYPRVRAILEQAFAAWPGGASTVPPPLLARARLAEGTVLRFLARIPESIAALEHALELARTIGDRVTVVRALAGIANSHAARAEWPLAEQHFAAALEVQRGLDDPRTEGQLLTMHAAAAYNQERLDEARASLDEALLRLRDAGDIRFEAMAVSSVGIVALGRGALEEARLRFHEALRMHEEASDAHWHAVTTGYVAALEHAARRLDRARSLYLRAIRSLREIGVARAEGITMGWFGALLVEEGDLGDAEGRLHAALRLHRRASPDYEGVILAMLAVIHARRGDVGSARALLGDGESRQSGYPRPSFRAAIRIHRLHVEWEAAPSDDPARRAAVIDQARREHDAQWSIEGRLALRLLERRLGGNEAHPAIAPPTGALVVDREGRWFQPPGGERVSLHRRHALRLLMRALVEHRLEVPGEALSVSLLVERGWPGERIKAEAAAERVYTAIATLRRLGLREILRRCDDGYLLDPGVACVRA